MVNILVQTIQVIGCLVPIAGIIALFYKRQSTSSMYLILTNIGCLFMNIGYLFQMRSTGFKEALIAYKMEYIGSIMFYLFFGLFVISYFTKKYARRGFYLWGIFEMIPLVCLLNDRTLRILFRSLTFAYHPIFHFHYIKFSAPEMRCLESSMIFWTFPKLNPENADYRRGICASSHAE